MAKTSNTKPKRAGPAPKSKAAQSGALTIAEISKDKLTQLANKHWSSAVLAGGEAPAFSEELVQQIYRDELGGGSDSPPSLRRVTMLELSQYLENYLWPNFPEEGATSAHVLSILAMVNEKFREGVPAWTCFRQSRPEVFPAFFRAFLALKATDGELHMHERITYLLFAINAFQSLEEEAVRKEVLRLVSLPLWHALSPGRLQLELHDHPALLKHWRHAARREARAAAAAGDAHMPVQRRPEASFLPALVDEFLSVLGGVQEEGTDRRTTLYLERFVEFLTDLLSQLPTRRFVHALLDDRAVLVKCTLSPLCSGRGQQGVLFAQLVDLFRFYSGFPIADHTGEALGEEEVVAAHYERIQALQRLFFRHVPELRDLALASCAQVQRRDVLSKALHGLEPATLRRLVCRQLRLVGEDDPWAEDPEFLVEVAVTAYERRRLQAETVNAMPLYPTERVLFDEHQVPTLHYTGETVLALPKLNLQFLTIQDYLMRNFNLFRLEATYEIREDIADVLQRVQPYLRENDEVGFNGWARMVKNLEGFTITEVQPPKVGEMRPAAVSAEVVVDLSSLREDVRREWEEVKQHDVMFLLTLRPPDAYAQSAAAESGAGDGGTGASLMRKYGLDYVRGCEVIEMRDEDGQLLNDFTGRVRPDQVTRPKGSIRTMTVAMDAAQYQMDMDAVEASGAEDVYGTFNLLLRRKPKENNFKAVLESIRDLMNADCAVPAWLHDILLGYGDPDAALYKNMEDTLQTIDFKDTFLDADHLREAFPECDVSLTSSRADGQLVRPFRVTFPSFREDDAGAKARRPTLHAEAYTAVDPGPYPEDEPPQNGVRFTPVQTSAVLSGVQPGLTMVVGPPGTGKTDTAVQIMHILYHNCPGQRTLIITHSNQALNDLFTKIVERDVPARYLLRLGMGEADLETEEVFSRVGRVNAMLARRLQLLAEVERLARLLRVSESVAYTCETAAHFWLLHVLSRWERFLAAARKGGEAGAVAALFPFAEYFADAPQPLFRGADFDEDLEKAKGCFRHLQRMFQELEETRPFELLRTQADRINYLLTKQAKIVAMTCTHAALKRREFLELGFKYDNLLMEESAQILEIETFIPMLLQKQEDGVSRLKRVIMIGDHHQLPPVVKNMAMQKYSNLDQPLFTRFIRLGTPYIELNAQGRARPSLARLYNWRYRDLGDLPHVAALPAFAAANAGFAHDYQLVDVQDYNGRGETSPMPYFYQNLGEAEYLVSVYQYMRLLGYPASSVAVLTTYNGQTALLRDVFQRRCAAHPAFGMPSKIATVDKFQGQQADYVLLSLVRTAHFGHLRDVRRLVVAMSRSRLGLYVFGRAALFSECYELAPTFRQLTARPTALALAPHERHGACARPVGEAPPSPVVVPDVQAMAVLVAQMVAHWEAAAMAAGYGGGGQYPASAPPGDDVGVEEGAAAEGATGEDPDDDGVVEDEDAADPAEEKADNKAGAEEPDEAGEQRAEEGAGPMAED
uniref:Intron-binding protein aquarius n=2 Tax=Auxenochlorella protothecoides TaxID=3075 RepID=A0A1D2ABG5_AUXPR